MPPALQARFAALSLTLSDQWQIVERMALTIVRDRWRVSRSRADPSRGPIDTVRCAGESNAC